MVLLLPLGLSGCGDGADTGRAADTSAAPDHTEVIGDTDDTAADTGGDTGADEDTLLYEAFYDPGVVQVVELTLTEAAIAELRTDPSRYVSGTFQTGDTVFQDVGVRLKGTEPDWDAKPGFKIRLDEYVADQRYAGLERLTLNAMGKDPAQAREVVGYALWAEAGMVVPRANYAQLVVNGEEYGLYANVESVDDRFLKRRYADAEGDLWEGNEEADFTENGIERFELVSGEGDEAALRAAWQAVYDADFYASAGEVLDMPQFLAFWAWSIASGSADAYPYDLDDFFIYNDPADGRFEFVPWGMDEGWDTEMEVDAVRAQLAVVCRRDEACAQALADSVTLALEDYEATDPGALAEASFAVSEAAVVADPRRSAWTAEEVAAARVELRSWIDGWPARVRAATAR